MIDLVFGYTVTLLAIVHECSSATDATYTALNNLPECDYREIPAGGSVVIKSKNYPNYSGELCKYRVTTNNNHKIGMTCSMGMGVSELSPFNYPNQL